MVMSAPCRNMSVWHAKMINDDYVDPIGELDSPHLLLTKKIVIQLFILY